MNCPADGVLEELLRGGAAAEAEAALAAHLEHCELCRGRLETLAGGSGWCAAGKGAVGLPPSPVLEETIRLLEAAAVVPDGPEGDEPLDFLAPPVLPDSIGRLGGYDILERIASGGMGIVFRAQDAALQRMVAIKVLAPALARHALARARFIREARAAAAVTHDHVVGIHAVEELHGLPCIIMQYVKGRSLAARLREAGPMRLEEMLRAGAQAAAGLAAAHAQGLVHRDIKPGNILLENGVERVKLTDFGLARAVDDTTLTHAGQMAGTPEFMAPEQARGEGVDQRADLFSLGCVLYAMATGRSPFGGGNTMAVLRRVCEEGPEPLRKVMPLLPPWFCEIVARLMEKRPAARYGSAAEVAAILEDRLRQCQSGVMPGPRPPRWLLPVSAAAVLATGAALIIAHRGPGDHASVPPQQERSVGAGAPVVALLQPGGTREVFTSLRDAVQAAAAGATIEITAGGRLDTEMLEISGKPLRLRAAPGVQPVLYQPDPMAGMLATDAPLVVEGLALERAPISVPLELPLRRNPPALAHHAESLSETPRRPRDRASAPAPAPLVQVRGAPLLLTHCRLSVRDAGSLLPEASSAAINLDNSGGAVIQHSEILAVHAFGIDGEATELRISETVFLGRGFLRTGPHATGARRIDVDHCTVAAQVFLTPDKHSPEGAAVTFSLRHSALDVDSVVTVPPALRGDFAFKAAWRWSGEGNIYSVSEYFMTSRVSRAGDLKTLADWRAFWPAEELASIEAKMAFPRLPLVSGGLNEFHAAHMGYTLGAEANSTGAGANALSAGPGAAYDRARAEGDMAAWDAVAAKALTPQR